MIKNIIFFIGLFFSLSIVANNDTRLVHTCTEHIYSCCYKTEWGEGLWVRNTEDCSIADGAKPVTQSSPLHQKCFGPIFENTEILNPCPN